MSGWGKIDLGGVKLGEKIPRQRRENFLLWAPPKSYYGHLETQGMVWGGRAGRDCPHVHRPVRAKVTVFVFVVKPMEVVAGRKWFGCWLQ